MAREGKTSSVHTYENAHETVRHVLGPSGAAFGGPAHPLRCANFARRMALQNFRSNSGDVWKLFIEYSVSSEFLAYPSPFVGIEVQLWWRDKLLQRPSPRKPSTFREHVPEIPVLSAFTGKQRVGGIGNIVQIQCLTKSVSPFEHAHINSASLAVQGYSGSLNVNG